MKPNQKIELSEAKIIAESVVNKLSPYCDRIQVAGSIRRKKKYVSDIEIVCIPKHDEYPTQGGESILLRSSLFQQSVLNIGTIKKGKIKTGRYIKIITDNNIQIDLFITHADIWGMILAIRTGSANFSHNVLAKKWVALGYRSKDGILYRNGNMIFIREEKQLFDLLNIIYISPENRTYRDE